MMKQSDKSGRVLDVEVALAHVDGDTQLLSELAEMFVQDFPRMAEDLREGILHSDYAIVERTAHTLRGRLAFFGITMLREQLSDLERMGRDQDLAAALELLTDIKIAMDPIVVEFETLTRGKGRES
jgi:HPt (histidine-containing phosphotransfer) domain-containing protein